MVSLPRIIVRSRPGSLVSEASLATLRPASASQPIHLDVIESVIKGHHISQIMSTATRIILSDDVPVLVDIVDGRVRPL